MRLPKAPLKARSNASDLMDRYGDSKRVCDLGMDLVKGPFFADEGTHQDRAALVSHVHDMTTYDDRRVDSTVR